MSDTIRVDTGVKKVQVQAPPGQATAFFVRQRVPDEPCCGNIPQAEIDQAFKRIRVVS